MKKKQEGEKTLSRTEMRRKRRVRNQIVAYISICVFILLLFGGAFFGFQSIAKNIEEKKETKKLAEDLAEMQKQSEEQTVVEAVPETTEVYTQEDLLEEVVDSCISEMTLEDKIAGLFVVTPEALTGVDIATKAGDGTKEALAKYPVGGIVYFAKNIVSEEQFKEMVTVTNDSAKYPLFLAVDEEGGTVSRIANSAIKVDKVSSAIDIGDSGDSQQAYDAAKTISTYMSKFGLNLNFAPVADVITEGNATIGKRSFGNDPTIVSEMVKKSVMGFQESGISSCVKHFPGLGFTTEDTHEGMETTKKTKAELQTSEFPPFIAGMEAGVDMVMVSHLCVPDIAGGQVPSSLSKEMVTDILRSEMQYKGIVITDALNMKAITEYYSTGEACVNALSAGVDMLLMPENFEEAYEAIKVAVSEGKITEDRIEESLERIYRVKYRGVLEQ